MTERDKWVCEMNGNDFVYHPTSNEYPNWFHRKMQYWILGFKWIPRSEWEARSGNDPNFGKQMNVQRS